MARVNVEQKALTDGRYVELGRLIGADRHAALGRMILVWNECQERETHTLSRAAIDNTNPDIFDFCSLMIRAELARETKHGVYVAGAKDRCGWLGKARKNGRLGGRPKKNQTVIKTKPSGSAENNPPAPAPSPALETVSPSAAPAADDAFFCELWEQYPRKLGRKAAQKHFRASVKTAQDRIDVAAALVAARAEFAKREPQYVPHGSTWFSNWRDYIPAARPPESPPKMPQSALSLAEWRRKREEEAEKNGTETTTPQP